MIENLFFVGFVGAAVSLLFAFFQGRKVMRYPDGNDVMKKIAKAIRTGADAI